MDALDQIELADQLGFDYLWEVEHHFLEEYSHSSAPEVFLAAASQRTRNIRLGHGIIHLQNAVNAPARVAERIATLDLLSGGRVDFGGGEGSSQAELGGFGVPREHKRAVYEENLEVITRMLVEEPFQGHAGDWLDLPPRNVVPKPKQKPHPPLWVACSRRDTIEYAARRGLGALSFSFVEPEDAKPWVDAYYDIFERECVPAGFDVNPNLAVVLPFMCHTDEATAIERGIDGAHFFGYSLAHYYVFGDHRPAQTSIHEEFQRYRQKRGFARDLIRPGANELSVRVIQGTTGSLRGAVGTPEQLADLCRRYEAAGVDQIILCGQCGHNQHEHICEALELFGKQVMPEFKERCETREQLKRERLAPARERALARRPRRTSPGPDEYAIRVDGEPKPAPNAKPRRKPRQRTRSPLEVLRDRQQRQARKLFGEVVKRMNDQSIEQWVGSDTGLALLFKAMELSYRPTREAPREETLQFELQANGHGTKIWKVQVRNGKLRASSGPADKPDATVKTSVVSFFRMAAGELDSGKALMDGKVRFRGDSNTATRILEATGQTSYY